MQLRTGLIVFLGLLGASVLVLWLVTATPPPAPVEVKLAPPVEAPPPPPPPPVAETPPPPAEPELPALPEVKVAERPIHAPPPDAGPPATGHALDDHGTAHPGQSEEVALGPHALAPTPPPKQFSGTATPTGGVELKVDATMISLFGIKKATDRDHCGADADSDCAAAARHALADRLGPAPKVSCRIPNPHPGTVAYAICLDANGVDLSGFLIAQGLALADTSQSYDYVGAEGVARNLKRGLWKFR